MSDSRRPYGAEQPAEIDDLEDRSGSVEPLNFEDDDEDHE
ncbi:serine kinase/phosphatase, partial [Pseudomonas sp. FSL R10-0071]|nr:serine kinase/phosphatase [Pseudomonas sp. FSL R10-0071]